MRRGWLASAHKGDATAIAGAPEYLIVNLKAVQDVQDGQGDIRGAQNLATKIKHDFRRSLTLRDRARQQALDIIGVQLHA